MSSVFLTYRQENDAHSQKVHALACRLRDAGLEVVFDKFEEARNPGVGPPNGWDLWSIQQANAEKVLIIGSSGWFRVFNRHESSPKVGLGSAAEAECIAARMSATGGNTFAVMVYFEMADLAELPPYLRKCSRHDANQASTIELLVNWVKGVVPLPAPDPPIPSVTWPTEVVIPPAALADRHESCEFFRAMLTGVAEESVGCFIAESGTGKSRLLDVFFQVASQALTPFGKVAHLRNLGEFSVDNFVDRLCVNLGGYPSFCSYEQAVLMGRPDRTRQAAFLHDLRLHADPIVIIIDNWDGATEELRVWILGHLIPGVLRASAAKLIIAGRPCSQYPETKLGEICSFVLDHIDYDQWEDFIEKRYPNDAATLKPMVRLLLDKAPSPAHGVKTIAHILELMDSSLSYSSVYGRRA